MTVEPPSGCDRGAGCSMVFPAFVRFHDRPDVMACFRCRAMFPADVPAEASAGPLFDEAAR